MKYQLTLSKEQLAIVCSALDFYSRCGMGQIEEVCHLFTKPFSNWDIVSSQEFRNFKWKLTGFDLHASHGIASPEVRQEFKEAYSMQKQIDKGLWDLDNEKGNARQHSVDKDGDMLKLGEPLKFETKEL